MTTGDILQKPSDAQGWGVVQAVTEPSLLLFRDSSLPPPVSGGNSLLGHPGGPQALWCPGWGRVSPCVPRTESSCLRTALMDQPLLTTLAVLLAPCLLSWIKSPSCSSVTSS